MNTAGGGVHFIRERKRRARQRGRYKVRGMRLNTFSQGLAKTTRDAPYLSLQNVREAKEEHTGDTILGTPHTNGLRI